MKKNHWLEGKKLLLPLTVTIVLFSLLISGCITEFASDYSSLLSKLGNSGATIEEHGYTQSNLDSRLSSKDRSVIVNGSNIHIFEYDTRAAMEEAAKSVSPDGSKIERNNITTITTTNQVK